MDEPSRAGHPADDPRRAAYPPDEPTRPGHPAGEPGRRMRAGQAADEPTRHPAGPRPGERAHPDPAVARRGQPGDETAPQRVVGEAAQRPASGAAPRVVAFSTAQAGVASGVGALLTAVLIFGSRLDQPVYAAACLAVQLLFVGAWVLGGRPPGPWVVAGVGIAAAIGADVAAVYSPGASLAPLGYVVAAAFVLGVVGQLVRGAGRSRVTESIGSVAVSTVGVVALATPILLSRQPVGREALLACLAAAGVGLVVARLTDIVVRVPRVSPHVPRGAPGVVLGAMAGTAVAGLAGWAVAGLTPGVAAVAGLVVAVAAVLSDLGMVFAEAGRQLAGERSSPWPVRAALGPLVGLAVATPAAYLLSVLLFVKGF